MAEEEVDLDALLDLRTPWSLRVAATLGIAGHLRAGPRTADELAAAAGCDAKALYVVLAHLAGKGVFTMDDRRFGLNPAAERLDQMAPYLDLDGIGGRLAGAWGTLLDYVRTGEPGYAERFGRPFWADLAAHPELSAAFDALMGPDGHGTPDHDIELTGGWDGIRTVVDIGGGTGAMLAELLRRHRDVHGILVDLPATIARSGPLFAAAGVADRVTTVGQSFFDPLPAGADLYLLKKVLNDWPDRETVLILRRCAEAAGTDGRVVGHARGLPGACGRRRPDRGGGGGSRRPVRRRVPPLTLSRATSGGGPA
jgi:2,7-dihydroxy-5-methyl-1-naphthoate 7-O-methyltransferase